jgi:hypothetical protein
VDTCLGFPPGDFAWKMHLLTEEELTAVLESNR